jgi:hypothetical protein
MWPLEVTLSTIGAMFLLIAVLFKSSLPDMFAGIRRVHPQTE